jgi:hypothetical protein
MHDLKYQAAAYELGWRLARLSLTKRLCSLFTKVWCELPDWFTPLLDFTVRRKWRALGGKYKSVIATNIPDNLENYTEFLTGFPYQLVDHLRTIGLTKGFRSPWFALAVHQTERQVWRAVTHSENILPEQQFSF